jgi:hypothetical protein
VKTSLLRVYQLRKHSNNYGVRDDDDNDDDRDDGVIYFN